MLRSGKEHLETLRDGRIVYVGSEKDRRRHPPPCVPRGCRTVAAIYDMKADPANRDTMTYEEDGSRHSIYFLRARSRDDLQRRMIGHRKSPISPSACSAAPPITWPPSSPEWR